MYSMSNTYNLYNGYTCIYIYIQQIHYRNIAVKSYWEGSRHHPLLSLSFLSRSAVFDSLAYPIRCFTKDYKSIVPSGHRRLTKQTGQNMLVTVSELINTNRHMYSNNNELRMKDGICQQTNSSRIVDYHPRMEHMKHLKPTKITRQFERFPPSHDC